MRSASLNCYDVWKTSKRINSDIGVSPFSGGLRFHVSGVHMCLFVCELFCTLADLLPLLSVIFHLFLTFPPSFTLSAHFGPGVREVTGAVNGQICSGHGANTAKCLWSQKCT